MYGLRGSKFNRGDLERLWVKPIVYPTAKDDVVLLQWSANHISATATQTAGHGYSVLFLSANHIISYQ